MDRQYGLPVAFALAAHAALLFGFNKEPRAAVAPPSITGGKDFPIPPPPEPDSVIEIELTEAQPAKADLVAPLPTLPEPTPIDPGQHMVIPVPPRVTANVNGDATKIELPTGTPDGIGKGIGGNIVPIGLLDNTPRTRFQPTPPYPHEAKVQGLNGEVLVEFVVDENGRVRDPKVASSSHRVFEEAALRGIAKWVFEPGKRGGRVVPFKMAVPLQFKLSE
jgi:periplasmic protein TonB